MVKLWVDRLGLEGESLDPKVVGDDCRPLRNGLPSGRLVNVRAKTKVQAVSIYNRYLRAEEMGDAGIREMLLIDSQTAVDLLVALDSVEVL